MHATNAIRQQRPKPLELLRLSTPDADADGNPINVWDSIMGGRGVKPHMCLGCAGEWCDQCSADPLSASERERLRDPEPVRYL